MTSEINVFGKEVLINHENVSVIQVEKEVKNLYTDWGLSGECISLLAECGINSIEILSLMHSHDIDDIFNKRELLGEKIKFRYKMQNWRTDNKHSPLTCCGSDRTLPNTVSSWLTSQESTEMPYASNDLNIDNILSKTIRGKDILRKYKATNCLEESDQSSITAIIVDHLVFNEIKMDPKMMKKVSDAIVELFPTENVLTYYTQRSGKRNPSGKLYDRYFNRMPKRKRTLESPCTSALTNVEPSAEILHKNEECESKKNWLSRNIPEDITVLWKETSEYRMKERIDLAKILDDWPRYKDPNGPELINIDFETLYSGKGDLLFQKMKDFEKQFDDLFMSQIKDKLNLQYLKNMKSADLHLDSKHFYFFYLLHAVLVPPRITKTLKPSISDAQNDMITHLVNLNNFKQKEGELRELAIMEGLTLQPKIFVVGESISNLTEFYVYLNDEPNMRDMLQTLLFSWNLQHLMDYFEAENIDLNVLKIVTKDDLPELTQKMKIGDKIMFKYHFERWRAENKEFRNSPFCSSISNSSSQSSAGSDGEVEKTPKLRTIDILKQHKNGVLILDTYKKDNKITEDQRNVLINIIVQHFETNDIKMTMQMSRRIENDILKLFPTEKLQFYRTGSRGKLYIKYHNQNKKVARSFNSQGKTPRRSLLNTTNLPKMTMKLVPEDDAALRVQTLKSDSLSADDFMVTWSACAKFRLNQIHYECKNVSEALALWPQYKLPIGFQLIDNDFYIVSDTTRTLTEWTEKFVKLLEFLQTHLKTRGRDIKDILTSLDKYEFEKDTDAFILKILWCLHCQVYPTKKFVRTNENGEKEFVRLTIKDSQDSFLYINETMQGLQEYIDVITRKGEQKIPPFILGVGEPKTLNVEVFYVYLDGQLITFNNFWRAFDICFKSYYVFNIEYPFASWPFWTFIEKFLYGIHRTDKQNSKVCVLIDELSKM